jgi:hypothetical protein
MLMCPCWRLWLCCALHQTLHVAVLPPVVRVVNVIMLELGGFPECGHPAGGINTVDPILPTNSLNPILPVSMLVTAMPHLLGTPRDAGATDMRCSIHGVGLEAANIPCYAGQGRMNPTCWCQP